MSRIFSVAALLVGVAVLSHAATPSSIASNKLDEGYRDMYNLQFQAAHTAFQSWQQTHPQDPMGPVSDAAAYLFAEFDRLHVLESDLFIDDAKFESRRKLSADAGARKSFDSQMTRAKQLADGVLQHEPNNRDALFAKALMFGLQGDYAAMIEKRDMAGLGFMKQGRAIAERLLTIDPSYYDAYLAVGVENYLLGLKPAPVRWLLRIGGAETDKNSGVEKLRLTAEKGHYLLPYARLLLAVAALRDNDRDRAKQILAGLAQEFPQNHLYEKELAQLH